MHKDVMPATPARRAKIVRLYRGGDMTIRALSLRFGLSYWTIRNELLAAARSQAQEQHQSSKVIHWRNVAVLE